MERILVIKTEYLAPFLRREALFTERLGEISELIRKKGEFINRSAAEKDASYKQIIPYISIRRGGQLFATRRLAGGNEPRLHGRISLGVGGHIEPCDGDNPLSNGMLRELSEETDASLIDIPKLIGIINDDTNGVGSVHLGFLYTAVTYGEVNVRETDKLEGIWINAGDASAMTEKMESWSVIALPRLLRECNVNG